MSLYDRFFNQYPYRNISDTNLDWLFTNYQTIVDDVEELNEWRKTHTGEYEELKRRVDGIENEINTFEAQIERRFDDLDAAIHHDFDVLSAEIRSELAQTKAEIEREFADALAEFTRLFNELKASVELEIARMKSDILDLQYELSVQIASVREDTRIYIDAKFEDFIAHLPDYEHLIVRNPVTGQQTTVQAALDSLYDLFNVDGITAGEYDALMLSAGDYDDLEITAGEYDKHARTILGVPDERYYMRSPFTGEIVPVKDVVMDLWGLHNQGISAGDFDALELTAGEFDALEIQAYYYDMFGIPS